MWERSPRPRQDRHEAPSDPYAAPIDALIL